jgi:hypothetical protein
VRFWRRRTSESEVRFMRRHLLECATLMDEQRIEIEQLRLRGDRLVKEVERADETIQSAWRISNAMSAWREYSHD